MPYAENILEIYKTEYSKYEKTRDIQWKMNIAVWTLLSLFTYYIAKTDIKLKDIDLCLGIGLSLLIVFVHCRFLYQIQKSLDRSLGRLNEIGKFISNSLTDTDKITWEQINISPSLDKKGWVWLQTGVTIIFISTLWVLSFYAVK